MVPDGPGRDHSEHDEDDVSTFRIHEDNETSNSTTSNSRSLSVDDYLTLESLGLAARLVQMLLLFKSS
jgi:hypothetical protein